MATAVSLVAYAIGEGPHRDFNRFLDTLNTELARQRERLTARRKKLLRDSLAERDDSAVPVIKKQAPSNTAADPIKGLFELGLGSERRVVEFEPDPGLRDSEQIPLQEEDGIEGFLGREVLPYSEDAWYVPKSVKVGYEISFNRYFYRPEPMRTLEDIRADIQVVEAETSGLLEEILGVNN